MWVWPYFYSNPNKSIYFYSFINSNKRKCNGDHMWPRKLKLLTLQLFTASLPTLDLVQWFIVSSLFFSVEHLCLLKIKHRHKEAVNEAGTPTWALLPLSWSGLSVKVKVLVAQLCPTLCNPVDSSLSGSSVLGILQVTIQVGLPFPSPGDLPNIGIKPGSPALQMDSLPSEPAGKPWRNPWFL